MMGLVATLYTYVLSLAYSLFRLSLFLGVLAALFGALMFAAEIWGLYSAPPSEKYPKGVTLIVVRDEAEPFLNASDRPRAPVIAEDRPPQRNMFGNGTIKKRSVDERVVFRFPYIKMLHQRARDTVKVHRQAMFPPIR